MWAMAFRHCVGACPMGIGSLLLQSENSDAGRESHVRIVDDMVAKKFNNFSQWPLQLTMALHLPSLHCSSAMLCPRQRHPREAPQREVDDLFGRSFRRWLGIENASTRYLSNFMKHPTSQLPRAIDWPLIITHCSKSPEPTMAHSCASVIDFMR